MSLLVGISGFAGSGKDEAARALIEGGWRRVAFADKLREFAYKVNPWVHTYPDVGAVRLARLVDDLGWEDAKRRFPQVRDVLVSTGNTARELLGVNVWVDAVLKGYEGEALVIPDVRFRNEADAIRRAGGTLIRIDRPGVGPANDLLGQPYESETALDGYQFDQRILNDMSVEYLHGQVMLAMMAGPQRSLHTRW
ncbi:deoxynucleoside monophosphate kinase [Streptomyces phage Goby]|uniref:Deoxynucleoside monophosphate kinase n=2 Tax=Likavirus TaxID=1982880 RepID=R4TPF6_9CAUD|nr:deoxynucleoside monophosphate [Streptomyces phage Sujidade]YP_010056613.1 deoxynucleoside monophosphate [Streptomyces phage Goby]AGM12158.1 deoxynucleoside monophosphate kinase [Streptomyces phage Sujidade]AWN07578.1 deoxynucleoside monophosphate kinase [Streptomyces phage Goby]AWN07654.1 deoxynucleoside monophosphate kinase [Streptomyces phage Toma]